MQNGKKGEKGSRCCFRLGSCGSADGLEHVKKLCCGYDILCALMEDGSVCITGKTVSADVNCSHFSADLFMNPQKEGVKAHWNNIVSPVGGHKILVGIRSDGGIEAIALQRYE